mgnify:CR=1 FL=1
MRNPHADAFTLIELLLASTITTIIIGGGLMVMSMVLQAYKQEGNRSSAAETAQLILDRMRQDLNAAYLSPHQDMTRMVGYDQQSGLVDADSLTFISCINSPVLTGAGSSDLAEVQYYIDVDPETPERWLLRRFDATPDDDPFTGGSVALLGPKVESLDFQYYDSYTWWPDWDSQKGLPAAIIITIGIFQPLRPDEELTPDRLKTFSTTVWLAARRNITYEEALLVEEETMETP